jgi:adenine-specific DNA methylase
MMKKETTTSQKTSGAYFTPDHVAESLLRWVIRGETDRVLDPSCGDGQFIAGHRNSVGIEQDPRSAQQAIQRAPWALVHEGEFFSWAGNTTERFDCAAGNPPFIRYQTFKGEVRERAQALCARVGARFSGLSSSWAPFLVATATLLVRGGRMAFVVPAEIGHAPYAAPLISYLANNFATIHVIAIRDKLFPDLSEDCWLLYVDGYGGRTDEIRFTSLDSFKRMATPPKRFIRIGIDEWAKDWNFRLRPFLISNEAREAYKGTLTSGSTQRFGSIATINIGYVTGDNDFFHLRPSVAKRLRIPESLLHPTVRKGSSLPLKRLTNATLAGWRASDEQMLLLKLPKVGGTPISVSRYLDSEAGHQARQAYKCRVRDPWYSVPDVQVPNFFLSYMSGRQPSLVSNEANCTCTNSVHSVRLRKNVSPAALLSSWDSDFVRLSAELEGHPLGGGMLKLEPREATQIVIPSPEAIALLPGQAIAAALATLREWRHYGSEN